MALSSPLSSSLYTEDYFRQDDVCRLCWRKNADIVLISEAKEDANEKNLVDKIRYCLDINISEDIYPNKVCEACCNNIENFCEFKTFCLEADRKLRSIQMRNAAPFIKLEIPPYEVEIPANDDASSKLDSIESSLQSDSTCEPKDAQKKINLVNKFKAKRRLTFCTVCQIEFGSREEFVFHNFESHGVEGNGSFKCFGCNQRFKSRGMRQSHETSPCKGLKYGFKCCKCNIYLPKRGIYETHMRDHRANRSDVPENIFKCRHCQKIFMTKNLLVKHSEAHKPVNNNLSCNCCGRAFKRQEQLQKHKIMHDRAKRHVCPHCNITFGQKSSLNAHLRKHVGEFPLDCKHTKHYNAGSRPRLQQRRQLPSKQEATNSDTK